MKNYYGILFQFSLRMKTDIHNTKQRLRTSTLFERVAGVNSKRAYAHNGRRRAGFLRWPWNILVNKF